ncbi:uncharacterized protein LOC128232903 isoform X2 [Mya arenaria]|uniref:uncharacterized protein LOC128232903 isoform X2 n=1 Tax=Mya arenaria TaxID=6604 RepID=UPI0022E10DFD|nr:uncharacterized protein LOC128232903 isoform X2 [Mya arenaria]
MEAQIKKRGRPRLSEEERKRKRIARHEAYTKTRVYLGSDFERWLKVKNENSLNSDREVATFLIDSYMHNKDHTEAKPDPLKTHMRTSTPSTGNIQHIERTSSLSEVSEAETDRKNMGLCLMKLYVTREMKSSVEMAIKSFFSQQGWRLNQPDISGSTLVTAPKEIHVEHTLQNNFNTNAQEEQSLTEGIKIKEEPPDYHDERMDTEAERREGYMFVFDNWNSLNDFENCKLKHLNDPENSHLNDLSHTFVEKPIKEEFVDPDMNGSKNDKKDDDPHDLMGAVEIKVEVEEYDSDDDVNRGTLMISQEESIMGNHGTETPGEVTQPPETEVNYVGDTCSMTNVSKKFHTKRTKY